MKVKHIIHSLGFVWFLYGLYLIIIDNRVFKLEHVDNFMHVFDLTSIIYTVVVILYFIIDLIQTHWDKKIL